MYIYFLLDYIYCIMHQKCQPTNTTQKHEQIFKFCHLKSSHIKAIDLYAYFHFVFIILCFYESAFVKIGK